MVRKRETTLSKAEEYTYNPKSQLDRLAAQITFAKVTGESLLGGLILGHRREDIQTRFRTGNARLKNLGQALDVIGQGRPVTMNMDAFPERQVIDGTVVKMIPLTPRKRENRLFKF